MGGVEGHVLDEPNGPAALPGEGGEVHDLVVVDAPHEDDVDLDRRQTGGLGGVHAREDGVESIATGDRREAPAVEGVTAHVHAAKTAVDEGAGQMGEADAVGRQGHVLEPQRRQLAHQDGEVGAHQRLAASEADGSDAEAVEYPSHALDLLVGEDALSRQPLHVLHRHAVRAPEVAAVGHRDAQIRVHAAEGVHQRALSRGGRGLALEPGFTNRGDHGVSLRGCERLWCWRAGGPVASGASTRP